MALEYSDSSDIDVVVKSDVMDKAYRKVAASLHEEEISDIIETSKGYYILYCAEDNDEEAQKENIENIIVKRQDDIFGEVYYKWLEKNDIYIVTNEENKQGVITSDGEILIETKNA